MTAAVLIPFLTALLTAAPELIKDVEALIADFKGKGTPTDAPITPGIVADMAANESALKALEKK